MPSISHLIKDIFGMMVYKPLSAYNRLETATHSGTLIAKDGSLVTVFKVLGTKNMSGSHELNAIVTNLESRFSPHFETTGHAMQLWFSRDPDLSENMLKGLLSPSRQVSKKLQLDIDDLFNEKQRHLKNIMIHESVYMAVWTRPAVLSKQELATMKLGMKPPALWPRQMDTHDFFRLSRALEYRHNGFVNGLKQDFKDVDIQVRPMLGHEALRAIKSTIYPDMYNSNWRPYLPGDIFNTKKSGGHSSVPYPRQPPQGSKDISPLLWPRLDNQIFDRGAEIVSNQIVRIGGYLMAGLDMTLGPQNLHSFTSLLNRMVDDEFPWRVSFLMEGSSFSGAKFMGQIAAMTAWSNSENRYIADAMKVIKEYQNQGGVCCRFRVSFATWAPCPDSLSETSSNLIEERLSRLQKAVEGWGYCQASPSSGDPVSGVLSSALGIDTSSTAPAGVAPLPYALRMLPWMRDASPFEHGPVLFRTIDGRPWPYQPGSKKQDASIDIFFAPSGKGKSVLMNSINLSFALSSRASNGDGLLPRMSILDIGPSSEGLISLIREALPPSLRNMVAFFRIKNEKKYAINPFDTQLGCRYPLRQEKDFLVNFLSILGTDPARKDPPDGTVGLAGMLIDMVYAQFSDSTQHGTPKPYEETEEKLVDMKLRDMGHVMQEDATWWDVVDVLFDANHIHEATLAQRRAVPLLQDLSQILSSVEIRDLFGDAVTQTQEALLSSFRRLVSLSIQAYPILAIPTQFSIGEARIVALDLGEATPGGSQVGAKQTSLVYMLGRHVSARDFYLKKDNLDEMNPDYRHYHEPRIRRLMETPKRLVMDEFHRTKGSPFVRQQVVVDMREGRKWGVQLAIASQFLTDFDRDMAAAATGFWILGANNEQETNAAAEFFGLSPTAHHAMSRLNGPTRMGAPFLVVLNMKDGKHEHLLYNTLGPIELWAFSTTTEDASIRNILYQKLGPQEARRRLSLRFPNGSAQDEVERRIERDSHNQDNVSVDKKGLSVIMGIVKEIESMSYENT